MTTIDVNEQFATERVSQIAAAEAAEARRIEAGAARAADFDARVAEGKLRPLGDGLFQVTDPGSYDNGETLRLTRVQGRTLLLPQHGLDEVDGRVSLYTAVPAWHQLGQVVPGGTSDVDTVMKLGGLNYDVVKRPVQFTPPGSLMSVVLPGQFVTVRTDTQDGLGVVGDRYEVFQNADAFGFLQDLVDRYDVTWESAGTMRGGRRVFVSLRMPDSIVIDANGVSDEIVPFIAAINSHDGSSMLQVVCTPWRPVCRNTERFAIRDAHSRWGVRHTRNARDRIEEARRTLGLSVKYFERFAAEEALLAQTTVEIDAFRKLVDDLWGSPEDDAPQRTRTNYSNRVEALVGVWSANTERLGQTAYAAERAVTEFLDWHRNVRPGSSSLRGDNLAVRATAMLEGDDDDKKSKAHRQLLTLVKR